MWGLAVAGETHQHGLSWVMLLQLLPLQQQQRSCGACDGGLHTTCVGFMHVGCIESPSL
jgi:hypothetical protein